MSSVPSVHFTDDGSSAPDPAPGEELVAESPHLDVNEAARNSSSLEVGSLLVAFYE